ncbi:MAG: DUF2332 domain-containing protein [Desulfobulbus sp.]|nr:DUF2332 domain-containing protein [Desulfobulbus sp.]
MADTQSRLARRFRLQHAFTAGYSPLYARLFGIIADWLVEKDGGDPLIKWLTEAATRRSTFDVTLLLLAGLHRDILAGCPDVAALAEYYPTVGGTRSCQDEEIALCLRQALASRQEALTAFLRTARVQTNESARGICWLLPLCYPGWQAVHLVELGAGAGLNLVADQRRYCLACGDPESSDTVELGYGTSPQFSVNSEGVFEPPPVTSCPEIRTRTGADIAPVHLKERSDELYLASFVWGDQPERLDRLYQGVAAIQRISGSGAPVLLHQVDLPDQLPSFLEDKIAPLDNAPVVVFNTYLRTYLRDKGDSLQRHLSFWALKRVQPVLWLQWEPVRDGVQPPDPGWIAWTADLWDHGSHHHWHLAWTHPHGNRIQWLPDWHAWTKYWQMNSR